MAITNPLLDNYARLQDELADACNRAQRKLSEITLIAVSKFHRAEDIALIAQTGQFDFGENYIQESEIKRRELGEFASRLRWHMIGSLQTRKAKYAAGVFSLIHTVDSEKIAHELERHLAITGKKQNILLEVNIAEEPQKSGIFANKLFDLGTFILEKCPHLNLEGLMCMPPVFDAGDKARPWFAKLAKLRESLALNLGLPLPCLSMGMSGDFKAAIAEGATMVRIGTAIFGPRPPK